MANEGSDGDLLKGQLLFGPRQIPVQYEQRSTKRIEADALVDAKTPLTEVLPTNKSNSEVKHYAPLDLSDYFESYSTAGNIDLPNVLTSLSVVYTNGGSNADYTETANIAASGTSWSVGASVSGTAQASSFSLPKAIPLITPPTATNVQIINCYFFTTSLDTANILAILTAKLGATVLAWPLFKAKPITLILSGQKVSASARRDYQGSASDSPSGVTLTQSDGIGTQFDYTPSVEIVEIPPTIHGAISLTVSGSQSHTGTTTVTVNGGVISGGGTSTVTALASSSVAFTSLSPTTPAALPTSGLYLYRVDTDTTTTYGNFLIHAQVFDFAQIA